MGEPSLTATLLGFQQLYDEGVWDDARLADAVMHLDVDGEGEPGEILALRARLTTLEADRLRAERTDPQQLREDRDAFAQTAAMVMSRLRELAAGQDDAPLKAQLHELANLLAGRCIDSARAQLPPCPATGQRCPCWLDSFSRAHCAAQAAEDTVSS